jgi:hypothetical protein
MSKLDALIPAFFKFLNNIKVYHWQTTNYAEHIATDNLHTQMSLLIDQFVEVIQGKKGVDRLRVNDDDPIVLYNINDIDIIRYMEAFKYFLVSELPDIIKMPGMGQSDLLNIRDEMLSILNKTIYLFSLN